MICDLFQSSVTTQISKAIDTSSSGCIASLPATWFLSNEQKKIFTSLWFAFSYTKFNRQPSLIAYIVNCWSKLADWKVLLPRKFGFCLSLPEQDVECTLDSTGELKIYAPSIHQYGFIQIEDVGPPYSPKCFATELQDMGFPCKYTFGSLFQLYDWPDIKKKLQSARYHLQNGQSP